MRRPFRTASVSGLAAVAVYLVATVLGGLLHPGYSHVRDAISELTASLAPHRAPLAALYVVYNLLLVGFARGLLRPGPGSRLLRSAFGLVVVAAAAGIAQVTLGLLERITIGGYLAWVAITCLVLLRIPGREAGLTPGRDTAAPRAAPPAPADARRAR